VAKERWIDKHDFLPTQDLDTEYECAICGYNKWDIGLEFHHVKDGHMLLCCPCHRSYHPEIAKGHEPGTAPFRWDFKGDPNLCRALRAGPCDGAPLITGRWYRNKSGKRTGEILHLAKIDALTAPQGDDLPVPKALALPGKAGSQ